MKVVEAICFVKYRHVLGRRRKNFISSHIGIVWFAKFPCVSTCILIVVFTLILGIVQDVPQPAMTEEEERNTKRK